MSDYANHLNRRDFIRSLVIAGLAAGTLPPALATFLGNKTAEDLYAEWAGTTDSHAVDVYLSRNQSYTVISDRNTGREIARSEPVPTPQKLGDVQASVWDEYQSALHNLKAKAYAQTGTPFKEVFVPSAVTLCEEDPQAVLTAMGMPLLQQPVRLVQLDHTVLMSPYGGKGLGGGGGGNSDDKPLQLVHRGSSYGSGGGGGME